MKKKIIIICLITFILIISGSVLLLINKKEGKKVEVNNPTYKTFDMYVKINPLVRLTFKVEYEKCWDSYTGEENICGTGREEVTSYELINDDSKDIYKDMDFTNKTVLDALVMLCDVARDNKVAYGSLSITTNWDDLYDDKVIKETLKEKSKYEMDFDIFVDFKELEDKDTIIKELEEDGNQEFVVTFDRNNGDSVIKRKVKENESVSEVSSGEKKGYTFVEWQLNGKKYDFTKAVTKDIKLVAKWEKEVTTTKKTDITTNTTKKEETTTTTTSKTTTLTTTTSTTTTSTTTKANYSSRIDKINLNENILVYESSNHMTSGKGCGGELYFMVFVDNADTALQDYKYSKNTYQVSYHKDFEKLYEKLNGEYDEEKRQNIENEIWQTCETYTTDFENKMKSLQYNSTKENNALSVLNKLKNGTIRGITNFDYRFENHAFSYSYSYLVMENSSSFGDFGKEFNRLSDITELKSAFADITMISTYCHGGCGGYSDPEIVILNETLCKKYNLICDRW